MAPVAPPQIINLRNNADIWKERERERERGVGVTEDGARNSVR